MADPKVIHMSEEKYQEFSSDTRPDHVKAAELIKANPDDVEGYRAESNPKKQGDMCISVYMKGDQMPLVSNQAGENVVGESGLSAPAVPGPEQGGPPAGEGRSDAPVDHSPEVRTDSDPMATPETSEPAAAPAPKAPARSSSASDKDSGGKPADKK